MNIEAHTINGIRIAEIITDTVILHTAADGVDLLGNIYYNGFDRVILHQENITPDFFDLKSGLAGEVLQKFSNYRIRLAIVGDFSAYGSKSLKDFMYESNKGGAINFLTSTSEALRKLAGG